MALRGSLVVQLRRPASGGVLLGGVRSGIVPQRFEAQQRRPQRFPLRRERGTPRTPGCLLEQGFRILPRLELDVRLQKLFVGIETNKTTLFRNIESITKSLEIVAT